MKTILDITLNNCCTYRCDYCISHSVMAPHRNVKNDFNEIRGIYEACGPELKYTALSDVLFSVKGVDKIAQFTGGEPLLYNAIQPLVETALLFDYKVMIATNANQLRFNKDLICDDIFFKISWHPDFRNIEAFEYDIEPLSHIKKNCIVNYVAHPKNINNGAIEEHRINLEFMKMKGWDYEITSFEGEYIDGCSYNRFWNGYNRYLTARSKSPLEDRFYYSINNIGDVMRKRSVIGNIYTDMKKVVNAINDKSDPCNAKCHTVCPLVESYYKIMENYEGYEL